MWKIVVIALLSYLALASARPEQYDGGLYIPTRHPHRCGENEIYKSCTSSSCAEATCERPRVGPACTADCVYGCFCQRGMCTLSILYPQSPPTKYKHKIKRSWDLPKTCGN
uniref:Putative trypsin inhibitor like cysteine rich domain protein n=1 Tax=Ixodes scapularis TaxID=6945 RepID=A0A4D5RUW2_IXOSC